MLCCYLFVILWGNIYKCINAAGFIIEEKNWPPFFPIIHHDIAKEIPVNAQRIQYLAFASWLGIFCINIFLKKEIIIFCINLALFFFQVVFYYLVLAAA